MILQKTNRVFRLAVIWALIMAALSIIALPAPVLAATYTLEPIADGSSINLQVSGGGSNWEAARYSDGSPYVWENQNGWSIDLYELPDVEPEGTINSVTVWIRGKAIPPITREGAWPALRTHDATYPQGAPQQVLLTDEWVDYATVFTTNPYSGDPWTWDEVNSLEAGVRLRTSDTGPESQVDHVWVVINYGLATQVPVFPSIYIGIAAVLGTGILAYFMRRRLVSHKG